MTYHILSLRQHHVEFLSGYYYPLDRVIDFFELIEQVLSPNYCESTSELVDLNFSTMKSEEYSTYEIALCSMDVFVSTLHDHIVVCTGASHNYRFAAFHGSDLIISVEQSTPRNMSGLLCIADLCNQE